jgi:hypothetical protein
MTTIITNINNNITNVNDFINEVIYATSSNITDIQKLITLLQSSMINMADNFMKSDNITKKLLASTITEMSSITDTNTLKLSKEVNDSIMNVKEYTNTSIVLIRDRLSDLVHGQYNTSMTLLDIIRNQGSDNAILKTHSEHIKVLEDTDNELVNVIAQLHGNATSWKEYSMLTNQKHDDNINDLKLNEIINMQKISNMTGRLDYLSNDVIQGIRASLDSCSKNGVKIEQDVKAIIDKQDKLSAKVTSHHHYHSPIIITTTTITTATTSTTTTTATTTIATTTIIITITITIKGIIDGGYHNNNDK